MSSNVCLLCSRQWPEVYALCLNVSHFSAHCASQKTHVHARIARVSRKNLIPRATAYCAHSFQCMSITKMKVHVTGETEEDKRFEKCDKISIDCRTFYQTERDTKATVARQKRSLPNERTRNTITSGDVQVSNFNGDCSCNQLKQKTRLLLQIPVY